jgi:hypothetical protein
MNIGIIKKTRDFVVQLEEAHDIETIRSAADMDEKPPLGHGVIVVFR